jgi:hypothetical protein
MGCRFSNVLRGLRRVGATVSLTVVLVTASGGLGVAQSSRSASSEGLAGTWMVELTLRSCDNGAPLGPVIHSLVTFHRGGTISESPAGLNFAPGQRTSAHGVWDYDQGRTYTQKMVSLILFDSAPNLPGTPGFDPSLPVSPGFFAGWQTITHAIDLRDADHLASAGTNVFSKFDGTLYRKGCSTAVGRRFK